MRAIRRDDWRGTALGRGGQRTGGQQRNPGNNTVGGRGNGCPKVPGTTRATVGVGSPLMRRIGRIGAVPATVVAEVAVCAALVLGVHLAQGEDPGAGRSRGRPFRYTWSSSLRSPSSTTAAGRFTESERRHRLTACCHGQ